MAGVKIDVTECSGNICKVWFYLFLSLSRKSECIRVLLSEFVDKKDLSVILTTTKTANLGF